MKWNSNENAWEFDYLFNSLYVKSKQNINFTCTYKTNGCYHILY